MSVYIVGVHDHQVELRAARANEHQQQGAREGKMKPSFHDGRTKDLGWWRLQRCTHSSENI